MHNQCLGLGEQFVAMFTWDLSNGVNLAVLIEPRFGKICLATDVTFIDSLRAGMEPHVDLQSIGIPKYFVTGGTLQS